jgi:di/tricarboxylate transporter
MSEIHLVLSLLVITIVLFSLELISIDLITLLLLVVLMLTGILTPIEAFSGFSNPIIIVLGSIFVISGALIKTGLLSWFTERLQVLINKPKRLLFTLMATSGIISALISNTSSTAILMPVTLELSRKSKISSRELLMPLAFASILGGTCTLFGTSTNIAASGFLESMGIRPFSVFEFLMIGGLIAITGIFYLLFIGIKLLPKLESENLEKTYKLNDYLTEVFIPENSEFIGQTLGTFKKQLPDLKVVALYRGDDRFQPYAQRKLCAADHLIVRGKRQSLLDIKSQKNVEIVTGEFKDLPTRRLKMTEAVIMPQSQLANRKLQELDLIQQYKVSVLAIYRRGRLFPTRLRQVVLKVGDVLLLEGADDDFHSLHGNPDLWGLNETVTASPGRKGWFVLVMLLLGIGLAAFNILPLSLAMLMAALATIFSGCISAEEAYGFIEGRLLILIAGMIAFGLAMQKTGAASYSAEYILQWTLPYGINAVYAAFAVLTMILTQPMSNAAAALVVLPIALASAETLSIDPRSIAVMVTLSASLSFITPFEPASLLVYGPGRYRFLDFIKVGLPLTVIALILLLTFVPIIWPPT